ncbi:MAG: hypothetical protein ACPGTP_06710, partial [Bacteroidia bacterium]
TDLNFYQNNGTESTQNITAVQAFIGTPPWANGATPIAMTAQDGAFTEDLSSMNEGSVYYSSLGGNLGAQVLFTAPKLGNENLVPEVRFGMSMVLGKEAVVEFDDGLNSHTFFSNNSLMYCFVENETKFNAEIVWRVNDTKKVTFYSGLGANVSGSFANELYVFRDYLNNRTISGNNFEAASDNSIENTFSGKSVMYQRLYIPIGVDLKMFRHLQGTIEYKIGGGVEEVIGGSASTFRTGEFNFGMRLNIAKNNTPSILDYLY